MSDGLARFNELPREEAEQRLMACFAQRGWASKLAAGRPYSERGALLAAADYSWSELSDPDWRAVFESHPRIGERGGHSPEASQREQVRATQARPETLAALAEENRGYEARFGHVFLIAAAGRSGEEILAELRRRMSNDAATEFETAKEELRKISRMRLEAVCDQ